MIENIAKLCHEANRAYCRLTGDNSQLPWDEAPQWQRDSAIAGVRHRVENPDAPISASHESWSKQKIADGWVYGECKNPEKKEHPCLVPFEMLPETQKAKDAIFVSIVLAHGVAR